MHGCFQEKGVRRTLISPSEKYVAVSGSGKSGTFPSMKN